MLTLPPYIANPLRVFLQGQGAPPDVIDPAGELDPALLLSAYADTMTFRSNVTPAIPIPVSAAGGPSGIVLPLLQPELTVTGPGGTFVWAPRGSPVPGVGLMVSLLAIGTVFTLGYAVGKRAH